MCFPLDSGFAMSESELSLESGTGTEEDPYSFEPSGTESDSSAATSSDDSEHNSLIDMSW